MPHASDGTEPAASVYTAARVPVLSCVVMVGAGVVLLLVSALVTGARKPRIEVSSSEAVSSTHHFNAEGVALV